MELTTIIPTNSTSTHCIHGSLTGPLGILVQASLAAIAFSALIVKRYCEPVKTRRPWKTWWLDTSKQAVGAGVIHMANVYISEALFIGDPCTWYIISFMLDSTVGLFFICVCLKACLWLIVRNSYRMLLFGNYEGPVACTSWFYQCLIYVVVMVVEKLLVTLLTLQHFWTRLSSWMLSATSSATMELIIVMFLVPLVVNALVFWVVDNYLKLHHVSPSLKNHRHYRLFSGDGGCSDDSDDGGCSDDSVRINDDGGTNESGGGSNGIVYLNGTYEDNEKPLKSCVMYEKKKDVGGGHDDYVDDEEGKVP